MSSQREALMQALRAIDATLSVQVIAREQIVHAIEALDAADDQQEQPPGDAPAGCRHPNRFDLGLPGGQEMCHDCGETI